MPAEKVPDCLACVGSILKACLGHILEARDLNGGSTVMRAFLSSPVLVLKRFVFPSVQTGPFRRLKLDILTPICQG